ncbi:unnamed protein product [Rotaria magnacalcarata]|uniref:Beta-lactamase-related domain-containing protein n=1 Tax=Rotaria magnacalcarata TaxID=392030 RepID=A0A8S2P1B7_9BILA|nr:unnamed protein product [Rotaria magnacalcarata]
MLLYLLFGITVTIAAHQCPPCRTWIEHQLRNAHIPGLAAIVVNSSDILYEQDFGFHSPPGNVTYYTNVGAVWGALAIERISGLTFENYVRQGILDPSGISTSDASYRLSSFTMRKIDLVDQYVYNVSLLSIYHQIIPQLNVVQATNSTDWLYIPHYSISVYPAAMLRMSARSLSIYLRLFLNNFSPDLLRNVSSMNEMLHVSRQEGSLDEPGVQYVGHRGWMPGVAHTMMVNEKRSLGIILLSNGDITWSDSLAKQASSTLTDITGQLFDCFEQ